MPRIRTEIRTHRIKQSQKSSVLVGIYIWLYCIHNRSRWFNKFPEEVRVVPQFGRDKDDVVTLARRQFINKVRLSNVHLEIRMCKTVILKGDYIVSTCERTKLHIFFIGLSHGLGLSMDQVMRYTHLVPLI